MKVINPEDMEVLKFDHKEILNIIGCLFNKRN